MLTKRFLPLWLALLALALLCAALWMAFCLCGAAVTGPWQAVAAPSASLPLQDVGLQRAMTPFGSVADALSGTSATQAGDYLTQANAACTAALSSPEAAQLSLLLYYQSLQRALQSAPVTGGGAYAKLGCAPAAGPTAAPGKATLTDSAWFSFATGAYPAQRRSDSTVREPAVESAPVSDGASIQQATSL